jgi:O-antigen ligase
MRAGKGGNVQFVCADGLPAAQPQRGVRAKIAAMSSLATFLALAIPWLNPFSMAPTAAVMPWLVSLGCFAVVFLWATRVQLVELTAAAWLTAALLSSVIGLLQYFGVAALFSPWVNYTGVGEAFANLRQRNQFATLTNIGLAALLWWVAQGQPTTTLQGDATRTSSFNRRALGSVVAAALLAVGTAASSSRTGLVQLLMLSVMAWVWGRLGNARRSPDTGRVVMAALLAYGVAALALPVLAGLDPHASGILARLHDGDSRCASRLTLWRNVMYLIAQKPWLGWGWGELDYAHFITLYPGDRFCEILDNAHNLPLHLAVELGLPLAVAVCASGLWLAWRARPWRESDATRQLAWGVLAVILLHSLLEYPLWYGPFQMALGLSIWLLVRRPDRIAVNFRSFRPLAPVQQAWIALFLIASIVYAMWDYHRVSQIYRAYPLRSEAYRDNTLAKIADSRLFQGQVQFAELTTTPLSAANAAHLNALAKAMLHFSPEPSVVEKLIESALLLGRDDEAQFYLARYRAAFPASHARWAQKNSR